MIIHDTFINHYIYCHYHNNIIIITYHILYMYIIYDAYLSYIIVQIMHNCRYMYPFIMYCHIYHDTFMIKNDHSCYIIYSHDNFLSCALLWSASSKHLIECRALSISLSTCRLYHSISTVHPPLGISLRLKSYPWFRL